MPPKRRITKNDVMQHLHMMRQGAPSAMLPRAGFSPFSHSMASKQHYGGLTGFGMMGGLTGFGSGGLLLGGRKRAPRKTIGHAKNQARGAIVRQLMMQHGMTLPQASHYIKANNIAY